jgi:hypothetical protein
MTSSTWKRVMVGMMVATVFVVGSAAEAQNADESKWSADVGIGWDNGLSGHINSSGVGTLNNQVVVVLKKSYEDVYGTGLNIRFGGGYMLNESTEVTGMFTFQSLDADFITPMGDIGVSKLYGQYTDYQTFGLDVGLRKYGIINDKVKAYGEGTLGFGFIDKIDVKLVAPSINFVGQANDFYDQTAAFAAGVNAGILVQTGKRLGVYGQIGLRFQSGLSPVDDLAGTGLDNINDKSSRWTLPFIGGVRYRF